MGIHLRATGHKSDALTVMPPSHSSCYLTNSDKAMKHDITTAVTETTDIKLTTKQPSVITVRDDDTLKQCLGPTQKHGRHGQISGGVALTLKTLLKRVR